MWWTYFGDLDRAKQYNATIDKTWNVNFTVSMSHKSMKALPPSVNKQVSIPGTYSVEQLFIDFTTAQLDTFLPSSNTPGVQVSLLWQ